MEACGYRRGRKVALARDTVPVTGRRQELRAYGSLSSLTKKGSKPGLQIGSMRHARRSLLSKRCD